MNGMRGLELCSGLDCALVLSRPYRAVENWLVTASWGFARSFIPGCHMTGFSALTWALRAATGGVSWEMQKAETAGAEGSDRGVRRVEGPMQVSIHLHVASVVAVPGGGRGERQKEECRKRIPTIPLKHVQGHCP